MRRRRNRSRRTSGLNQVRPDSAAITEESADQRVECSPHNGVDGFVRFCERHCTIQDRKQRVEIPFILFPGQRRAARYIVSGVPLIILKSRQVGFTWLFVAYSLWRLINHAYYTIAVVNQERGYAIDFVRRLRWMHDRLPSYFQMRATKRTDELMRWETDTKLCEIRSMVGSDNAARSITGDLVIADEASRVPCLLDTYQAVQPALEVAGGQFILLTTSAGPGDAFHGLWTEIYGENTVEVTPDGMFIGDKVDRLTGLGGSGFLPLFIHYSERPGRDAAWYAEQKYKLRLLGPTAIKQEHPETPEEAFEYALGRVFPQFDRGRHVHELAKGVPDTAIRYRAIDFGDVSPYCVLWIAHMPRMDTGFVVHPSCTGLIKELLGYRWDEKTGMPQDGNDHAIDALRYAVVNYDLRGLLYVYREVYRPDSVALGWTLPKEIKEIHELSGWVESGPYRQAEWEPGPEGEIFAGTVADRSLSKVIAEMGLHDLPVDAAKIPGKHQRHLATDSKKFEVVDGCRLVRALIDGTINLEKKFELTPEQEALSEWREDRRLPLRAAVSLERKLTYQRARDHLRELEKAARDRAGGL